MFNFYDTNQSGDLDYNEFTQVLFGKRPATTATGSRGGGSNMDALLQRVRDKLKARGAKGIFGLGRSFRIVDDNGSGTLDINEFGKAMRDYMLGFSGEEI